MSFKPQLVIMTKFHIFDTNASKDFTQGCDFINMILKLQYQTYIKNYKRTL